MLSHRRPRLRQTIVSISMRHNVSRNTATRAPTSPRHGDAPGVLHELPGFVVRLRLEPPQARLTSAEFGADSHLKRLVSLKHDIRPRGQQNQMRLRYNTNGTAVTYMRGRGGCVQMRRASRPPSCWRHSSLEGGCENGQALQTVARGAFHCRRPCVHATRQRSFPATVLSRPAHDEHAWGTERQPTPHHVTTQAMTQGMGDHGLDGPRKRTYCRRDSSLLTKYATVRRRASCRQRKSIT